MTRILEGIFVIGCALVGFGIGTPEGSGIRNTMKCSIQLVSMANENVATNAARLTADLARVPVKILSGLRRE